MLGRQDEGRTHVPKHRLVDEDLPEGQGHATEVRGGAGEVDLTADRQDPVATNGDLGELLQVAVTHASILDGTDQRDADRGDQIRCVGILMLNLPVGRDDELDEVTIDGREHHMSELKGVQIERFACFIE